MRLAIGVPTSHGFPIPSEFWMSYEQMASWLRHGYGVQFDSGDTEDTCVTHFELMTSQSFPVDVARNQIVRSMLAGAFDALLFLDADHIVPKDLVDRLARHNVDVVTARYHVRRPPFHANAYVRHPLAKYEGQFKTVHYGQGLFEIDRGGAGALLIQRKVLQAIGDDWFRYQRDPDPEKPSDFTVSEDFWFYQRAQEEGFKCYVDWDTEVEHLATIPVGLAMQQAYLDAMEKELTPEMAKELVACGYDAPIRVAGYPISPYRPPKVA